MVVCVVLYMSSPEPDANSVVCPVGEIHTSCFVQENWVTLIDEDETAVLEWASCVNRDKLVLHYLHHVKVISHSLWS